jgi:hypothetical protein
VAAPISEDRMALTRIQPGIFWWRESPKKRLYGELAVVVKNTNEAVQKTLKAGVYSH